MDDQVDVWVMAFADTGDETVARVADTFGIDAEVASRLVESTPTAVKRDVDPSSGLALRRALEELGADVQVILTGTEPAREDAPPPAAVSELPLPDLSAPLAPLSVDPPAPESSAAVVGVASGPPPPPPVPEGPLAPPIDVAPAAELGLSASLKTLMAIGAGLGAVLLIGSVAFVLNDGDDESVSMAGDADSVCGRELADRAGHAEAREWLQSSRHTMMGLADPSHATGLVNALYLGGATEVQVTQIEGSRFQQTAGVLCAAIPPGGVDALAAAADVGLGLEDNRVAITENARVERGERYLRITLWEPPPPSRQSSLWEEERELRESSRATERGLGNADPE